MPDLTHPRPATRIETEPHRDERPETFASGRRCLHPRCPTVLNRYNPGPFCNTHEDSRHVRFTPPESMASLMAEAPGPA